MALPKWADEALSNADLQSQLDALIELAEQKAEQLTIAAMQLQKEALRADTRLEQLQLQHKALHYLNQAEELLREVMS